MAGDHGPPAELRGAEGIDLGYATEFHILLRAIDAAMPEDATLYLEGDGIVTLAASLPDETIERFRDALGPTLRRPKRRTWLWSRPRDD